MPNRKDCDTCAHYKNGPNIVCAECVNIGMFSLTRTPSKWEPAGPMVSEIFPDCTWDEAMEIAGNKGEGWYLPEPWELAVMYKAKTLGREELQDMNGYFWSSSPHVAYPGCAYSFDFSDGCMYDMLPKSSLCDIRYVRAGYIDSLVKWIREKEAKK